jgi:hypothetical protein
MTRSQQTYIDTQRTFVGAIKRKHAFVAELVRIIASIKSELDDIESIRENQRVSSYGKDVSRKSILIKQLTYILTVTRQRLFDMETVALSGTGAFYDVVELFCPEKKSECGLVSYDQDQSDESRQLYHKNALTYYRQPVDQGLVP